MPGSIVRSVADGVSADGAVVVGNSHATSGQVAFRWTATGGLEALGDLPGGGFHSVALDLTPDASVVVGQGNSAGGQEAFRWTLAGGMQGLGDLPGGDFGWRRASTSSAWSRQRARSPADSP